MSETQTPRMVSARRVNHLDKPLPKYIVAFDDAAKIEADLIDAIKQRNEWADECEKNMKMLKESIELGELAVKQRDVLADALEDALNNCLWRSDSEVSLSSEESHRIYDKVISALVFCGRRIA